MAEGADEMGVVGEAGQLSGLLDAVPLLEQDLTRLCDTPFRRSELKGGEMTEVIELFQALERNKNDGSFGSDMRQMIALLNLLIRSQRSRWPP